MGKFLAQPQIWLIRLMTTLAMLFEVSISQVKTVEHGYLYKSSIGSSQEIQASSKYHFGH